MSKKDLKCGIVMPLSDIDGVSSTHWEEVRSIIEEAISDTRKFTPNLVSEADDTTIIHKTIVKNLYDNPILVCDVSARNANVMFELGLRLAFDKPTIIIKDHKTPSSFDTSSIEYLEYPRDLRFAAIVEFKEKLTKKILATYEKSQDDKDYTTFLKHFGTFKTVDIKEEKVTVDSYLLEELQSIKRSMINLEKESTRKQNHNYYRNKNYHSNSTRNMYMFEFENITKNDMSKSYEKIRVLPYMLDLIVHESKQSNSFKLQLIVRDVSLNHILSDLGRLTPDDTVVTMISDGDITQY